MCKMFRTQEGADNSLNKIQELAESCAPEPAIIATNNISLDIHDMASDLGS